MSELKVNSIKGVGASSAAISVDNSSGSATANLTTVNSVVMPNGGFLSNRNLIINGAMQVAQRGTSSTSTGYQTVDRFKPYFTNTGNTVTQAQVDVASGTTPYTSGFRKALKMSMSGAGTVNANTELYVQYRMEAQDLANSGWNYTSSSSNITISFWVKASTNQTFYVRLFAADTGNQTYVFSYTASGNDTWTKITKTIPGNSNLVVNNDTGYGLSIIFYQFYGTDYTASRDLDTWANVSGNGTPDQASTWYTAGASTWEITGLQVEVGSVATDFEHKCYQDTLLRCFRYYYQQTNPSGVGTVVTTANTSRYHGIEHPVPMRASPTVSIQSTGSSGHQIVTDGNTNAIITSIATQVTRSMNTGVILNLSADLGDYRPAVLMVDSTSYETTWKFSAEL